jgi:hypothetical protein
MWILQWIFLRKNQLLNLSIKILFIFLILGSESNQLQAVVRRQKRPQLGKIFFIRVIPQSGKEQVHSLFVIITDDDEDDRNLRRVSYLRATKDFDSDVEEREEPLAESKRLKKNHSSRV